MSDKKIHAYSGKEIDVFWDERLCIHIAECLKAEGDMFNLDRFPWCQPDLVSVEKAMEIVERCPTGSLFYITKEGERTENAVEENTIFVTYNGPFFVSGDLEIDGVPEEMRGVRFRAALCRCGKSKNKPFCDNKHVEANFQDYGAVGEEGCGLERRGGKLKIKPVKDGPLLISGNATIVSSNGRAAWEGDKAALCRCGCSKCSPFCDGSHKEAGFNSE